MPTFTLLWLVIALFTSPTPNGGYHDQVCNCYIKAQEDSLIADMARTYVR